MLDRDPAKSTWAYVLFSACAWPVIALASFNRYRLDGNALALIAGVGSAIATIYFALRLYRKVSARR